jgi:hypothetical protein
MQQSFSNPHTPAALASRFARAAQRWLPDGPAERADSARRKLLPSGGDVGGALAVRLERLAQSELRAVERAIEILERGN